MSSISEDIYISIKDQIIDGKLKPGDKLPTEVEMCKIWSTSRMSVREAMQRLMALGILRKIQGGGTYVSESDPSIFLDPLLPFVIFREENILDILKFRSIIEIGSVKLCAENRDAENLGNMKRYLDEMDNNKGCNVKFAEADLEFHMEIARASKNPINVKINEMLRHTMRKHQINVNGLVGVSTSIKEHKNIYVAVEEQDLKLAEHLMEKHILRTVDDVNRTNFQE